MENAFKNYRQELLTSIRLKDLTQIGKHIRLAEEEGFDSFEWRKYSFEIFAMLTDSTIPMPTFTRRKIVFDAFKTAIHSRLRTKQDNEDNEDLRKNVQYLIRVIMSIVDSLNLREADEQTKKLFSNLVVKILLVCSGLKEPELSSLIELKIKLLKSVYPFPANYKMGKKDIRKIVNDQDQSNNQVSNLSNQIDPLKNPVATEFIYKDLVLWYEMGLELKNFIDQDCCSQTSCWNHLNELRSKLDDVRQPNLKVIYLYNLLQQTIKMLELYKDSSMIEKNALSIVNKVTSEIKYNLAQYYQTNNQRSKETCHNVFLTTLRFNIILPCYVLMSMIPNNGNQSLFTSIKQIREVLAVVILPLCQQKKEGSLANKQNKLFEKIFKFQIQLKIIDFDLQILQRTYSFDKIQSINQKSPIRNSKFWSSIHFNNGHLNQTQVTDYQKLLEQELTNFRSSNKDKASEVIQMSVLVPAVVKLLHSNFQFFTSIIQKHLSPPQILKVCTSLLTQFHFRQENLLQFSIEVAKLTIIIYFDNPEIIQSQEEVQNILNAANVLRLSKNEPSLNYCSFCGKFQRAQFCVYCGQICFKACKPSLNFEGIWHEFYENTQLFKKNERIRLKERVGSPLFQELSSICNN